MAPIVATVIVRDRTKFESRDTVKTDVLFKAKVCARILLRRGEWILLTSTEKGCRKEGELKSNYFGFFRKGFF